MKFGQALKMLFKEKGLSNVEVAKAHYMNNSTLGRYLEGSRTMPPELVQKFIQENDDPRLTIIGASEMTGGASAPYLDGEGADLHKSSVHLKTQEELREVLDAMSRVPITKRNDQLSECSRQEIHNALMEAIEALTALTHYIAVLCKEYCFSYCSIWRQHRRELRDKKYIQ